jgi:hypothetical protein
MHDRCGSYELGKIFVTEGLTAVISLLMPFILCFTVIASVILGVLAAYIAVFGILSTFRHPAQPEPAPVRPRLVLVPTQTHASGD